MPRQSSLPSALADRIERLLSERQEHTDALASIDQKLEEIGRILGQPVGRPRQAGAARVKGPRKRGTFATTAEESILAFVKQKGSPTTQEIKKLWKSEGRGGTADNELSRLVKNRKLKRTAIPGERGSRYTLP